jgi:hypothetical protein
MKDYIVYVKLINDKKAATGKMPTHRFLSSFGRAVNGEKWKLVYFEFKSTKRAAEAKEKKLGSLNKKVLLDMVKISNPELLDLKYTINESSILEELIY